MPNCCCTVLKCSNRGGHEFPKDNIRCKAWVIAIRREEKGGKKWWPTANSIVCKRHFLATDYVETTTYGKLSY